MPIIKIDPNTTAIYRVDFLGHQARIVSALRETPVCRGMSMPCGHSYEGSRWGVMEIDSFERAAALLAVGETLSVLGFSISDGAEFRIQMRRAMEHFDDMQTREASARLDAAEVSA